MNEFPTGLLIYLLIFAAVALFNYGIRRIEGWRKRQEQLPRHDEPHPRDQRIAETVRSVRRISTAEPAFGGPQARTRRSQAPTDSAAVTRLRSDTRSLLAGRRNLRRAIIAMTVLGPCRSQQPPDVD